MDKSWFDMCVTAGEFLYGEYPAEVLKALYETGVQVEADDHILTLITCDRSYGGASGRLIVMAVQQ